MSVHGEEGEQDRLLIEICCGENSELGKEAIRRKWKVARITRRQSIYRPKTLRKLKKLITEENLDRLGAREIAVHLSLPCTPFAAFSNLNLKRKSTRRGKLRIEHQRTVTRLIISRLTRILERKKEETIQRGKIRKWIFTKEWPKNSPGWKEEVVKSVEKKIVDKESRAGWVHERVEKFERK